MQCPVCKTAEMAARELEAELVSKQCPSCGGNWLPSYQYWKWREQHGPTLPELPPEAGLHITVTESDRPKLCPECGHILLPYRIGHALAFALDRCGHCGGIWFDQNEWEILKSRNLHDEIHRIFSHIWQAEIWSEERRKAREQRRLERFGEEDWAEIRRIKAWIEAHPRRQEILAFLLHPDA